MPSEKEWKVIEAHLRIALRCLEQRSTLTSEELLVVLNMHLASATELLGYCSESELRPNQEKQQPSVVTPVSLVGSSRLDVSSVVQKQPENTPSDVIARVTIPEKAKVVSAGVVQDGHAHEAKKLEQVKEPPQVVEKRKESVLPSQVSVSKPRVTAREKKSETPKAPQKIIADTYAAPPSVNDSSHVDAVLGTRLTPLKSIQKGMSVNDRLRYAADLCAGNREQFSQLVRSLDAASSLSEALALLQNSYTGAPDLPALKDFIMLIERRFA